MKKFSIKQITLNNMPTLMYWLDKKGMFTLKDCQAHENAHSTAIYCLDANHADETIKHLQSKFN